MSTERQLTRKIDLRIIPLAFVLNLASFLDRVNIGQARLYGIEKELDVGPQEYAWILSAFFIGYIVFEVPSNLIMKRASPPFWIGSIMVCWGITTACTAAVKGFNGLITVRLVLGLAEAGFFPGMIHYLSFWYTRQEQGVRIAILNSSTSLACAISGPISYCFGGLEGILGLHSWQWLFIAEGVPTVLLGVLVWIILPNTPLSAPWLTKQESELLQERLAESNVDLQTRRFNSKQFFGVFLDYKTYLFMLMFYGCMCPLYSIALLLPTIIKDLGFESKKTMLLTAPPYLVAIVFNMLLAWNSDRTMNRGFHVCGAALAAALGFVGMLIFDTTLLRYLALCLIACGICSITSPVLSWSNNTFIGSTRAATTAALVIMSASIGGIVAGQLYPESEAPMYIRSNTINLVNLLVTITLTFVLRFAFKYENRKLDRNTQTDEFHQFRYTL